MKLADGKDRQIRYIAASTTYWSPMTRPAITPQEFMEQLFGNLGSLVALRRRAAADLERSGAREGFIRAAGRSSATTSTAWKGTCAASSTPTNSDIFDVPRPTSGSPSTPLARAERADAPGQAGLGGYELEMRQLP